MIWDCLLREICECSHVVVRYHSPGCSSGSKMALLIEDLKAILTTAERGKT
jgi:hypothetical protein